MQEYYVKVSFFFKKYCSFFINSCLLPFIRNGDTNVYNFVSNIQQPITWGVYLDTCKKFSIKNPPLGALWYYILICCRNRYTYLATSFFLDFIPACLKDIIPFLTTGKHK
jgi:hypothetical protein